MSGQSLPSWRDDDLVPISALEHWSSSPRQCGLIHVEQIFDENRLTLRGRRLHERTDSGAASNERGVRQLRAITLWSDRVGLIGKSDVVEWRGDAVMPVEFKSGSSAGRDWKHEALQLCAQAICLEEMLGISIPQGAISSMSDRRRTPIEFTDALRRDVETATEAIRAMIARQELLPAINDARCRHCSLQETCAPGIVSQPQRLRRMQLELYHVPTAAQEIGHHPDFDEETPWNS